MVGFLALMRAVRFGRAVSRPFGLILAVTTVFAVARLVTPRTGSLMPRAEAVAGRGLLAVLTVVVPVSSFFVLLGHGWARWLAGVTGAVVIVVQPLLCLAVLGPDGLLRDGIPLVVTAVVALVALHRSRGVPTWTRPQP